MLYWYKLLHAFLANFVPIGCPLKVGSAGLCATET